MTDPELLYLEAEQYTERRGFFKPANPEKAIELFEKSGNLFKMKKNYERAGQSFKRAAEIQFQKGSQQTSLQNIKNAINCFKLINSPNMKDAMQLLVKLSQKVGNFVQAGKTLIDYAQQLQRQHTQEAYKEALENYRQALDILEAEQNVDSDIRTAKQNMAILEIEVNQNDESLQKAKDLYESIATQCLNIRLLQFHARTFFLRAFLCIVCLDDDVTTQQVYEQYSAMDPNMDGSPEGDFMNDICQAIEKGKKLKDFNQCHLKFMQRQSSRGENDLMTLIIKAGEKFIPEKEQQQQSVNQQQQIEDLPEKNDDNDLL